MGGVVAAAGGAVNYLAMEDGRKADRLDPLVSNYEGRFDGLVRDAQTKLIVAYTGYGLGAVGVGAGLWLVLSRTGSPAADATRFLDVAPLVGSDGPLGLTGILRF